MEGIYVDWRGIREVNDELPGLGTRAGIVRKQIFRLQQEIPSCISDRYQISQRLCEVYKKIRKLEFQLGELYEVTNECAEQYECAEMENNRSAEAFYW